MYEKTIEASGKIVVVGDGACGKTCLLEVFKRNKFPEEYIPTVVDNFVKEVTIPDDKIISLTLWDTAGQEDYDSVRPLSYRDTDLVLLCYSIENNELLDNISKKWLLELKNYCPSAGFFLVALKKDLRDENPNDPTIITLQQGENISNSIKAEKFIECSARTGENVDYIFEEAAKHIYNIKAKEKENKSKFCWFCC